jgi:ParB/RepB/Spo0J family partition protein
VRTDQVVEQMKPDALRPWRPRSGPVVIDELVSSIAAQGVLQPLIVRLNEGGRGEIICGERRWRAAQHLNLDVVPVLFVAGNDRAMQELWLIDNVQRVDLPPLDEADALYDLGATHGLDLDTIAARVGKPVATIVRTLKLRELIEPAKKLLRDGELSRTYALMLARLTPALQKEALDWMISEGEVKGRRVVRVSPAQFSQWIRSRTMLSLKRAPWDLADGRSFAKAGPCTTCPKRTGTNTALFEDLQAAEDTCTDPACYETKLGAQLKATAAAIASETGKAPVLVSESYAPDRKGATRAGLWAVAKANSCESVRGGLYVDGEKIGRRVTVCVDLHCKEHFKGIDRPRVAPTITPAEKAKRANANAALRFEVRRRAAIFEAIYPNRKYQDEDLREVASAFAKDVWHEHRRYASRAMGWEVPKGRNGALPDHLGYAEAWLKKADSVGVHRYLLALLVAKDLRVDKTNPARDTPALLLSVAKRYGVDLKAVEKKIKEEMTKKPAGGKKGKA